MSLSVVVLAGGLSAERDVSLRSGRRVAEALRAVAPDFEVIESDLDGRLLQQFADQAPDCVIPLLHGAAGEDGALRDVLDCAGITFVGASGEAARLAFDKPVAKTLVASAGIATPASVALPHSMFRELGAAAVLHVIAEHLGFPLIVKPTKGGSALGASIVHNAEEFPAAMVGAFAYCDVALMERAVIGTEVSISVIDTVDGPIALPSVQINAPGGMYDYNARYTAGTTEFFVPARIDTDLSEAASAVAITAHVSLGLRHWSRTDMIIDADGVCWFLETNVAPGMTETSLFPQSLAASGFSLGEVAADLVRLAVSGR